MKLFKGEMFRLESDGRRCVGAQNEEISLSLSVFSFVVHDPEVQQQKPRPISLSKKIIHTEKEETFLVVE